MPATAATDAAAKAATTVPAGTLAAASDYTAVWFTIAIIVIIVGVAIYVAIFFKSKKFEYRLAELLGKQDININNKDLLDQINATIMAERDAERNAPSIVRTIAHKIASDIRWDVAGLIGITVTLMLVIMIIAAQGDRIPEEVFVGWSVILGFYFGRTTAKTPKPSTEIIPQVTQSSSGTQGLLPQTPVQNTNQGSTT